jgi:hypothetical protein
MDSVLWFVLGDRTMGQLEGFVAHEFDAVADGQSRCSLGAASMGGSAIGVCFDQQPAVKPDRVSPLRGLADVSRFEQSVQGRRVEKGIIRSNAQAPIGPRLPTDCDEAREHIGRMAAKNAQSEFESPRLRDVISRV